MKKTENAAVGLAEQRAKNDENFADLIKRETKLSLKFAETLTVMSEISSNEFGSDENPENKIEH